MSDEKTDTTALAGFTNRETVLLAGALLCLKSGDMAIDYNKFADFGKFKNANSAKASWHTIKKKLDKITAGQTAATGTPASGKRKKDADTDADEHVPTTPTPAKKAKKAATKKNAKDSESPLKTETPISESPVKAEDDDDDLEY